MRWFGRRNKDLFVIPEQPQAVRSDLPAAAAEASPAGAGEFRMEVADVFVIARRGTVVTGRIETGFVHVGSRLVVERDGRQVLTVEVKGIETARKIKTKAAAGETVGLLLPGLARGDIVAHDVLCG